MVDDRYEVAWREFHDRLAWVQQAKGLPAKYLGMHVADVVNALIDEAHPGLRTGEPYQSAKRAEAGEG